MEGGQGGGTAKMGGGHTQKWQGGQWGGTAKKGGHIADDNDDDPKKGRGAHWRHDRRPKKGLHLIGAQNRSQTRATPPRPFGPSSEAAFPRCARECCSERAERTDNWLYIWQLNHPPLMSTQYTSGKWVLTFSTWMSYFVLFYLWLFFVKSLHLHLS